MTAVLPPARLDSCHDRTRWWFTCPDCNLEAVHSAAFQSHLVTRHGCTQREAEEIGLALLRAGAAFNDIGRRHGLRCCALCAEFRREYRAQLPLPCGQCIVHGERLVRQRVFSFEGCTRWRSHDGDAGAEGEGT